MFRKADTQFWARDAKPMRQSIITEHDGEQAHNSYMFCGWHGFLHDDAVNQLKVAFAVFGPRNISLELIGCDKGWLADGHRRLTFNSELSTSIELYDASYPCRAL